MLRFTSLLILLGTLLPSTIAQVSFGGQPYGAKAGKVGLPPAPVFQLPVIDVEAYMAQDEVDRIQRNPVPYRFGAPVPTDLGLDNSGSWSKMTNGDRVWRLAFHSPGALNITLIFSEFVIPEGAQVFVYNRDMEVAGAFTAASNPGHTELGVFPMRGDRLTVEYVEPASIAGQGRLRIGQVTHGYRDILGNGTKGLNDSGPCNINVICPEGDGWRDQIRSVAMIVAGGSGVCTGSLINNCSQDGTPYFLTANHCLGNPANWSFRFNWDSPTCTPTANAPTNQTVSGATLLASSAGSDVALLELNSTPPASYGVFYSGWDRSGAQPTAGTCIHHPQGDIKKISHDEDDAAQQVWGNPPAQTWRIPSWDSGTTENGSSGSGLWDQNGRLIGQLYGGQASCSFNFNDYYGRLDVSFPLLQQWLGASCGNTLDGYDPNGSSQQAWDAGITSISQIADQVCNANTITPQVTIRNYGSNAFSSVTVNYELNGGSPVNLTFNGTVAPGQTANFTLPSIAVANGANTLLVYTTDPNGQVDGDPTNDDRNASFSVASPGEVVSLQIRLDDFGSETTWELTPQGNSWVIDNGGPYQDNQSGTVVSTDVCLSSGCYTFLLDDVYNDGICCDFGNGDFWVLSSTGDTLANGNGDFNSTASVSFCLENVGVRTNILETGMRIWPNPGAGAFEVRFTTPSREQVRIDVQDALGRLVARRTLAAGVSNATLDLGDLADGSYAVVASSGTGRAVQRLVIRR